MMPRVLFVAALFLAAIAIGLAAAGLLHPSPAPRRVATADHGGPT